MITSLFERLFTEEKPPALGSEDAKLALAALLVRLARSDGDYAPSEIARIDQILKQHHGLGGADAAALRQQAEDIESKAPDTVRFTRVLKDAVDYEDRTDLIEALWQVAMADGERDAEEDGFMRLVSNLLGVNDRDSGLARQRVIARLGG